MKIMKINHAVMVMLLRKIYITIKSSKVYRRHIMLEFKVLNFTHIHKR